MPEDLALITGAGRGIGRAIARRIASAGIPVILVARSDEEITALRNEIIERGGKAYATPCDITISSEVNALHDDIESEIGIVNILVNNAGIAPSLKMEDTTDEIWRETMAVNLDGAFYMSRAFIPAMKKDGGHVISIASTAALEGFRYTAAYTASKHGLLGLMRALAAEYRSSSIKFSTICPGFTRTQILEEGIRSVIDRGRSREEAEEAFAKLNRESRIIEPEEIAETVYQIINNRIVGDARNLISGLAYHSDGSVIDNS